MKLKAEYLPYIEGEKFDSGKMYVIKGENRFGGKDKIDFLKKYFDGKKVVHLGCTDHIDCIDRKIKGDIWLHKVLTETCDECWGIDINNEAIDYIKEKYKGEKYAENIMLGDITTDFLKDNNIIAEYLFMGEILEHVDDPVGFLKSVVAHNKGQIQKIVITVPNMFSIDVKLASLLDIEWINTDHRYWFSPITLWKVATRAGLEVNRIELLSAAISSGISSANILKLFRRIWFEWKALNRKHIFLEASIKQGTI